jgi:hypothetical protein
MTDDLGLGKSPVATDSESQNPFRNHSRENLSGKNQNTAQPSTPSIFATPNTKICATRMHGSLGLRKTEDAHSEAGVP